MFKMPDNEALEKEILASQKLKELKKTQKLTPEQMHEKRKKAEKLKFEKQLKFEKKILLAAFGLALLGTLIFLVSFATNHWVHVDFEKPQEKEDDERGQGKYLKTGHYHGLWRFCRKEIWPEQEETSYCRKMTFDILPTTAPSRMELEKKMADFRRSTVAVGIIALVLSSMAHAFTWYSIQQVRYMFKRLAAFLQIITGACCWVVSEVFRQSVISEEESLKTNTGRVFSIRLGWSYYLVWASIVTFCIPGCLLLYYSKKRKRDNALSAEEAEENEPVNLGRL